MHTGSGRVQQERLHPSPTNHPTRRVVLLAHPFPFQQEDEMPARQRGWPEALAIGSSMMALIRRLLNGLYYMRNVILH
jgi:hypothetical protein